MTKQRNRPLGRLSKLVGWLTVGRVTGVSQHAAQIDHHLDIYILAMGAMEGLSLRTESDLKLAVVRVLHLADVLEQRNNMAPLDVVAGRMRKDLCDRVAMAASQLRLVHLSESS